MEESRRLGERGIYLDEKLAKYGQSDFYPFHMPGHKRRFCADTLENPYMVDITEIEGFDNLHHAEEILKEAQDRAAALYNAEETFYLVNGSTCGILSAISACTSLNGTILMARNCHKAAYHGAYLRGLNVEYLYPETEQTLSFGGGIWAGDVEEALERNPEIEAVLITSPTYDGVVSDVEKLAEIVHRYGLPLIVDEAHGAHFRFSEYFPVSALDKGADIVIQSLHKTLPSFTQTALLHRKGDRVSGERLRRFLGIYQSSSPSYIFMGGMDRCIRFLREDGDTAFERYTSRLEVCRRRLGGLKHLRLIDAAEIRGKGHVFDYDRSKLIISGAGTSLDGKQLYTVLLEKYHLQMEMTAGQYVIALTSVMDDDDGFLRLEEALFNIDKDLVGGSCTQELTFRNVKCETAGEICTTISRAMENEKEEIRLSESEGRISAEYAYLYPPGIPFLVPGERISRRILEQIRRWTEQGLYIQGLSDYTLNKICVMKQR